MRSPSPLYENLPYFYFAACILLVILYSNDGGALLAALALYLPGSIIWIMRSNYRRKDRREHRLRLAQINRGSLEGYTPEWLYEEQPFIYLVSGSACCVLPNNPLAIISATLFVLAGIYTLRMRIKNRHASGNTSTNTSKA